jgi:hypothetical protein
LVLLRSVTYCSSIVSRHHPKTGKFFVATKSAFNKNPKINHTDKDIDKNHWSRTGSCKNIKTCTQTPTKVTPKHGVYQGDLMHHAETKHLHEDFILKRKNTKFLSHLTPSHILHMEKKQKRLKNLKLV